MLRKDACSLQLQIDCSMHKQTDPLPNYRLYFACAYLNTRKRRYSFHRHVGRGAGLKQAELAFAS